MVCKRYSQIFNDGSYLTLFSYFVAQDETGAIVIKKQEGEITYGFHGHDFRSYSPSLGAIENVIRLLQQYKITQGEIVERFKRALSKSLGNYLAERELEGLEKELLG